MPTLLKKCVVCNSEKPLEQFSVGYKTKDGTKKLRNDCKSCCSKRYKSWFNNPEARAQVNARRRSDYKKDPTVRRGQNRKYSLKNNYGLDYKTVDARLKEVNYSCEICGCHEDDSYRGLKVDHDHKTGENRGMLCHNCNNGLSHFKDSIDNLLRACEYLFEDKGKKFQIKS